MTQPDTGWRGVMEGVERHSQALAGETVHLLSSEAALAARAAEACLLSQTCFLVAASFSSCSPAS